MSLASFALRICAVRAILGRTFCQDRVGDSTIDPVNLMRSGDRKPAVVISTDDTRSGEEGRATARDFLAPHTIDLCIEILHAAKVDAPDGTGSHIEIPHTDEGLELAINLIERQIMRALADGATVWSRLFMSFATSVGQVMTKRGASDGGARFAARLIVMPIDALADPEFGYLPDEGTPWDELLVAMRADADLAPLADIIATAIIGDTLPAWQFDRAASSFTPEEFAGIGLAPMAGEEAPAILTVVGVSSDDLGEDYDITAETP